MSRPTTDRRFISRRINCFCFTESSALAPERSARGLGGVFVDPRLGKGTFDRTISTPSPLSYHFHTDAYVSAAGADNGRRSAPGTVSERKTIMQRDGPTAAHDVEDEDVRQMPIGHAQANSLANYTPMVKNTGCDVARSDRATAAESFINWRGRRHSAWMQHIYAGRHTLCVRRPVRAGSAYLRSMFAWVRTCVALRGRQGRASHPWCQLSHR